MLSFCFEVGAGIFKQSTGARNRLGIGLSYWPARLHSMEVLEPWNRFLDALKVLMESDYPIGAIEFIRKFAEIFATFCLSPVSTTPAIVD